jgi:hypothetical protein
MGAVTEKVSMRRHKPFLTWRVMAVYLSADLTPNWGGSMRSGHIMIAMVGFALAACSTTEWVHPNKTSEEYTTDYNKCQNAVLSDPKLQQGSKFMVVNATERCMQKEGWRLVER